MCKWDKSWLPWLSLAADVAMPHAVHKQLALPADGFFLACSEYLTNYR